ncbi:DUF6896 domain-containing protein [Streptomyces rishiriensis]|uniref:DUF6896 domain-containing protein n=1 Tax=Streptomyces rishiriensis TaxID=68264 RepID=UPI003796AB29
MSAARPKGAPDARRGRRPFRSGFEFGTAVPLGHAHPPRHTVHGAGCRFVTGKGTEVDVDFEAHGSEIFDLWRLRWYGLSLPEPLDARDEDLRSAVRSLQPLLVEMRPGWFTVAN